MSFKKSKTKWGLLTVCLCGGLLTIATGQTPQAKPVEQLLPAGTAIYYTADGAANHKAAWEKTAAYEAMYESGMADVVEKVVRFVSTAGGRMETSPEMEAAMKQVDDNGVSLSVAFSEQGPPLPTLTAVVHKGANLTKAAAGYIQQNAQQMGLEFESKNVNGRNVMWTMIPNSPGVEIGFWAEGQHMMMAAGINAIESAINVAAGDADNITKNKLWNQFQLKNAESEATTSAWMDFAMVRSKFGSFPIPDTTGNVNDVLKALGLHNLNTLAFQYGYKGKSLWTNGHIQADGERTGLLSLMDTEAFTLSELPPLPKNVGSFTAFKMDHAKTWDVLETAARDVAKIFPPQATDMLDQQLGQLESVLGFDPKTQLLEPMGDLVCLYSDPDQGFMGSSSGLVCKVKDSAKLKRTMSQIYDLVSNMSRGEFKVETTEKNGQSVDIFNFGDQLRIGAVSIQDEWMIASLMPQSVDAFALRQKGKLPTWKPDAELAAALNEVPKKFNSIAVGDPRSAWQSLVKLAPVLLSAGEVGLKENRMIPREAKMPVTFADFPPAELIGQPLFKNVSVSVVDAKGLHTTSRQSLPGIPLISGAADGSSAATVAIGVALLLPAVQQAREAARRTQSKNNMKQIALALHNYHDVYTTFPAGTHPNEKLKPEKRFSWLARVLPFLEQAPLYNELEFDVAWDDDENKKMTSMVLNVYANPGVAAPPGPQAHYVGMAGVGKDAPELKVGHPRAGIFGHNRSTRLRDITDGTSNTIMVTEASKDFGNWAAGGKATYRALTKKPYINGPDGIGGPYKGGCNIGLADGSVRFVNENIDPKVMEALSTAAGGEVVGGF